MSLEKTKAALLGFAVALAACEERHPGGPDRELLVGEEGLLDASRGQRLRFQQTLDDIHALGITGVLGRLVVDSRAAVGVSGTAQLGMDAPLVATGSFRMGSNTKTFVAVVVLQLVQEGRLGLDDTVDRWLPGLVAGNGNDGEAVSIRQLLQHTSGLYNYTGDLTFLFTPEEYEKHRFEHADAAQLVGLAMQHPPDFAPGADWNYSNTNYILAGMIIERVTGRTWASEVSARIIVPLGLHQTHDPGDDPTLPDPHARSYEQFAEDGPLVDATQGNYSWAGPAGSLITTAADLSRFWTALQRGDLLSPAMMAQMHQTVPASPLHAVWPGAAYGLGIMWLPKTCGGGYWSHSGDTLGYRTMNAVNDDGSRAAALSASTQLSSSNSVTVYEEANQLFDRLMCAR